MAENIRKDRRLSNRQELARRVPGFMVTMTGREPLPALVFDVSSRGLGIFTDRPLRVGDQLILVTLEGEFGLVVSWSDDKVDTSGSFRCGLEVLDAAIDLERQFGDFWRACS